MGHCVADPFAQFQTLLTALLNPDNETRSQAEATLEEIPMAQRASLLFQAAMAGTLGAEQRNLSLVLLRRLFSNNWDELWPSLGAEVQTNFKAQLLAVTGAELDSTLRKKFCDLVAEIARNSISEDGSQHWPEVLNFLHECSQSTEGRLKESALNIFEAVPGIFGLQQSNFTPVIKSLFEGGLTFHGDPNVQSAAVRSVTAFLCDNDEDPHLLRAFSGLVPMMLKVCERVIDSEEDDDTPLQCLADVATSVPKVLKPHLNDVCTLCLKTVGNASKEDSFRHSALEVLVSLCETSAAMMRKFGAHFIPGIVHNCLSLMVDLDEDDEWATADALDDDDDNNATVGETSLDRVACGLGGKSISPICLPMVQTLLQNADWKQRHAGLMALSTISEGCKKAMEVKIEQIVDSVIPFLQDQHPRVRYAACNALGQMATDFAPTFEKKCHAKVVPALLLVIEDLNHPRVAAHAGAALVNFSEDCPKHVMVAYLDSVMHKLELVLEATFNAFLEKGKKLVLEQVITTIAAVADTAEERFTAYYDRVMPCLKYILVNANTNELRLLRGKTIECISLIGLAVGKEKFLPDANEVMQVLLKSQAEIGEMEADDPQISYMISASARICKLLGKDFAQYLPLVMPPVIKAAEFKPEVTLIDDDDAQTMTEDQDWQFVNLGDQQSFGIKTSGLEDKANACAMIVCYARELKEAFAEYVGPVTKLMVPLLKFYFHDGVRTAASESLPFLLKSGQIKGPEFVSEMWQYILPDLLKAIETEPEDDVVSEHMWSLTKCIEFLGERSFNEQQMQDVVKLMDKLLTRHFDKAAARDKKRREDDHDEEQETELQDEDEDATFVISKVSDVLHAMFGTYKEGMIPYLELLLPQLNKLLASRFYGDRQWGLCMFDDLIEFGGVHSVKYQEHFFQSMLEGLMDRMPEVRQAAAYGFGMMGMHGGNAYAQACAQAVPTLGMMIGREDARLTGESASATENAVAAVAKILKYNSSMIDANAILPALMSWLPVWEDKEESPHVYGYLCDLIESNNPIVLGENGTNLLGVVSIFADSFLKDAFDETGLEVAARMCRILRQMEGRSEVFAHLTSPQQEALQHAMAKYGV